MREIDYYKMTILGSHFSDVEFKYDDFTSRCNIAEAPIIFFKFHLFLPSSSAPALLHHKIVG